MFTRKDLLKGSQMVHAEMQRRAAEQPCACEHKENIPMENGLVLTSEYSGTPMETSLSIQENPTLDFNHTLTATAADSILLICGNLPLTIAVYEALHVGLPLPNIYSLEDSNRLLGDMAALNSVLARGKRLNKMCTKVNVTTNLSDFGNKQFTTYRFQGTNLIPEKFYLRNKLADPQNPKIAEFTMPAHLDLDVCFVVRATGGATQETLNIAISLANDRETLWPPK